MPSQQITAKVPTTFLGYLRSMGPGIVIALVWLGAGDLVDSAVAGGNYGYTLMWALALALFVRFTFVSIIAKYQLCNQHGENVLAGMRRIHRCVPWLVGIAGLVFAHIYNAFSLRGVGESMSQLTGWGNPFVWSTFWAAVAALIVFRGGFEHIKKLFYVFLGLLSISLLGVAIWSGPNPVEMARGMMLFAIPEQHGPYGVFLLLTSLIGAVGGSIANLLYPYFIEQNGWKGPRFRRVQLYDLAFGTLVVVILNLAVWTVGAEVLKPGGIEVTDLQSLANLITVVLGKWCGPLFYLGIFAATYSTVVGNATGYGLLCSDAARYWRRTSGESSAPTGPVNIQQSTVYRWVVAWCLISPLVWSLPGMPDFVTLTIVGNAVSVVVLPLLSAALWYITARTSCIGAQYRNRWWENCLMAILFALSVWSTYLFIERFVTWIFPMIT